MERNISVWLPLACPLLGTWPATQAYSLTGNRTGDPVVHRPILNPLSLTSQGSLKILMLLYTVFFIQSWSLSNANSHLFSSLSVSHHVPILNPNCKRSQSIGLFNTTVFLMASLESEANPVPSHSTHSFPEQKASGAICFHRKEDLCVAASVTDVPATVL